MKNAANSQYKSVPLPSLHESSTNPRRTFDKAKIVELANSIRVHGLIQPITVRPNQDGFEIIAGASRFAQRRSRSCPRLPCRVLALDDAAALEVQLIENSQRQDVHPYEEAAGYQRLLTMPGYDVAALADKCGKSERHIYSRLSLLQLIPDVADAYQQERISTSHANQIPRLPEAKQRMPSTLASVRSGQTMNPAYCP